MDSLAGRILEARQMLFIIMVVFLSSLAERSAVESAATGRALSSHHANASVDSTTTIQEPVIQWVQITAVPLGVFLLGACIWGIIHNTAISWGHSLNELAGSSSEAADEVPGADRRTMDRRDPQDLERRESAVELAHLPLDDIASALDAPVPRGGMQPELIDVPNA